MARSVKVIVVTIDQPGTIDRTGFEDRPAGTIPNRDVQP
jgi:hypothetical protein